MRTLKRPLSHVVGEGDVVFYGKFEPRGGPGPTDLVWVDTVLVVSSVISWLGGPKYPGALCKNAECRGRKKFALSSPSRFAERLSGVAAGTGAASTAYRFNLSDAEPAGMHCCNSLADYKVIVGASKASSEALADLQTSFVTLAERVGRVVRPASVTHRDVPRWTELVRFLDRDVRRQGAGPRGGWIAQFPDFDLARELSASLVASSGSTQGCPGTVAVPPLEPLHVTLLDPRGRAAAGRRTDP